MSQWLKDVWNSVKISRVVAGVGKESDRTLPILWNKWQYGRAEEIL